MVCALCISIKHYYVQSRVPWWSVYKPSCCQQLPLRTLLVLLDYSIFQANTHLQMIRKTMTEVVDVKAGLKIILDKLEAAFAQRSKVSRELRFVYWEILIGIRSSRTSSHKSRN